MADAPGGRAEDAIAVFKQELGQNVGVWKSVRNLAGPMVELLSLFKLSEPLIVMLFRIKSQKKSKIILVPNGGPYLYIAPHPRPWQSPMERRVYCSWSAMDVLSSRIRQIFFDILQTPTMYFPPQMP